MEIQPGFDAFETRFAAGENAALWTTLVADLDTPVSIMLKLAEARADSFLLESVTGGEVRGRYSIVGMKPDLIWRCRGAQAEINRAARYDADAFEPDPRPPLDSLRALMAESRIALPDALPPMAAGLFGFFGYDMVRLVERLPAPNPDPLGLPDAVLMRPTIIAIVDSVKDVVTLVAPVWAAAGESARAAYARAAERLSDAVALLDRAPGADRSPAPPPGPAPEPVSNTTDDEYRAMVGKAQDYIRAGDIFQVVPSQRWTVPFPLPPFALYRALRRTNPSPYMFFFNFGGFQVVGASPEVLVRLRGRTVTIRPIAGTRPRGATPEEDRRLEAELLADPKERAEHLMLLDLGRNDVGRVAKIGTVDPNAQFTIERYSHVMHIVSNVDGTLRDDLDAIDALLAGLPAGTVSGAPKVRAMEIIDELEKEKRGVYAGGVGYLASGGDMDMCIALRTAVVKDGALYVQAGGGVVYDSDPEAERMETVHKARALIRAAEDAARFAARGNR
ncbi:MAG: anthranilate synthase component I [Rhodobacteraceae bacterium]|nr:MAG: anthranilate synthase component I [Paracoccaceae bacterium]